MLPEASNDGKLLAVLLEGIELVSESGLELLTSDIRKLGFCNKRFCLSTDELLFKNNDAGAVRLLVLELSNLIGDLLLACGSNSSVQNSDVDKEDTHDLCWVELRPQYCGCS